MSEWLMPSGGSGQAVQGPKSASSESVSSETAKVWLSSQIQPPDDDLLLGQPLNSADAAGGLLTDDSLLSNPPTSLEGGSGSESVFRDSKAWDQLTYGGWMIDRQRMAIVYVPKGHADSWFSKWIELETVQQASQSGSVSQELVTLGSLSQQCKTCHLLSSARAEPNIIFEGSSCWRSERRAANLSPISKFDHTPHLALPAINDCRSCHQLAETGNPAGEGFSAEAVGGRHGLREFVPMQKNQCSSCHTANAAGESCTQCHNYHVGNASWR